MLGLKCHLITDLLLETNEVSIYSMSYNIFKMRKLSPREMKRSFYVTVSNSQKGDGREHQMDRLQGWLYPLQTFSSSSFPEGLWAS